MKWSKRNQHGAGYLGQGYESNGYVIEETHNYYELAKQYGGRQSDYYWMLRKGNKIIKYANTAKVLKKYVEALIEKGELTC